MLSKEIPEGMEECPECNGKGVAVYSCCTGDVIVGDIEMCPKCHEWLGEEECILCDGKCYVPVNTVSADKVDVGMIAENLMDSRYD